MDFAVLTFTDASLFLSVFWDLFVLVVQNFALWSGWPHFR